MIGQIKKTRTFLKTDEDTLMEMPFEDPNSNRGSEGTMKRLVHRIKWVSSMLLKPIDALITFWFYIQLGSYKFFVRRLPSLKMLSLAEQSEIMAELDYKNSRIQKLDDDLRNSNSLQNKMEEEHQGSVHTLKIELQDMRVESQRRETALEERIRAMNKKLKEVESEKEDALRRLSEIISVKLRDNNPNIVDLNDQCRPTKLAEMFSELYDNEWTNAYGVVANTFTETQSIVILLDIVMEAYEYCSVVVSGTWEHLEKWFFDHNAKASSEQQKVMKWLKDSRKAIIKHKVQEATQDFMEKMQHMCGEKRIESMLTNEDVAEYFGKCIELCLLMTANDPPVVIVCPDWKPYRLLTNGSAPPLYDVNQSEVEQESKRKNFNKELFKEYTKRGKFLEYIVWPVMKLHEGGSTLSKGVAQGTNDSAGSAGFAWRIKK